MCLELDAPKNYVKSDQVEQVKITAQDSYAKLTFVNERSTDAPWPSVSVQKVDGAGVSLAGVEFALYKASDTAFTTPIAHSISNASGIAVFTNIVPGNYIVKEVKALEGYIASDVTLPVMVTEDAAIFNAGTMVNHKIDEGNVAPDEDGNTGIGSDKPGTGNTDNGTGSNKPGTGNTGNGTGSNKPGSGSGNPETGIESSKPGLNDGNGNTAGGTNQKNQLPKTGDSISTMLWLFAGSGAIIVAYLFIARRRAHKQ